MKATKFFKLKAEWEKAKQEQQPVVNTITPVVEEVKQEKVVPTPETTKKKSIDA
jgi:hypothetical protein